MHDNGFNVLRSRDQLTPAKWKLTEGIISGSRRLRKQKSIGHLVHLALGPPLLELLQVVDKVGTGTLPRRSPGVVVDVVDTTVWIETTLPPVTNKQHLNLHYTESSTSYLNDQ